VEVASIVHAAHLAAGRRSGQEAIIALLLAIPSTGIDPGVKSCGDSKRYGVVARLNDAQCRPSLQREIELVGR
jgi:hypothetical protein